MSLFEINGHRGEMVVGGNISAVVFNEEAAQQGAPQEYLRPLPESSLPNDSTTPELTIAALGLSRATVSRKTA